ncbi:MAG: enoyl-CoA hydratase/isomerase family protein [Micavibrio sp.]|nr:enoyl-CoA hydratase/isomerase family protein [Micavibrio sp.]
MSDTASATTDVLFEVKGGIGVITLNRPQALNALNLPMIQAMDRQLVNWMTDDSIKAVLVRGAGDRAFCSGGDVKAVALEVKEGGNGTLGRDFFHDEYTLNHRIFTYPKPYIALINGIVMGGGKGISAHGSHRVVTENTLFAMPETNIGFFPDVGGGYFLPRCPGQTGEYLALTSKRIKAIDTVYIGFATHFVPAASIDALMESFTAIRWDDREKPAAQITKVLDQHCAPPPGESEIAPNRESIDRHFGHAKMEDIAASLEKDNSPFAADTRTAMYGMSPTSLKVALRQIRLGGQMSFADVMTMEYRLSQRMIRQHDFYEGIRAALIDKDRAPKWQPARIADVADDAVEAIFAPLGADDLIFTA